MSAIDEYIESVGPFVEAKHDSKSVSSMIVSSPQALSSLLGDVAGLQKDSEMRPAC
jgi:hypothetical protein